ncbi:MULTISPECIES: type II toxin-antitoxin system HipA family toxin [Acinetobacter]|uniref:Type II toxin-antitoxin system HipA family toxin n=1 Tax=Acinetobacter haemolyticus TaxID=29430 RepID=A0A1L6KMJ9_ACIHA|nr:MULTISPECIES: HipA domain-containing protein [Acinetobacter]APR70307.1 toxin HipA [Acinetobacter haemolyticus]ATZ67319.1 toxin HipA [Acinetobacter haemolyticus]EEH67643.1 HipA-like N-terminal domain protein [Acinetobacter sp. ATCC 27244]MQZ29625.1 HipA domain-containing protein [Acinetobacter haemolyticus]NAR19551.1 type II toxin-antitoxin system HipA family toxin [Acinetobacter haemolyticus]
MQKLTIQALLDQNWLDIAELKLLEPKLGSASASELVYELEYAIQNLDKRDEHACSLSLPVQILINHESSSWFGFLDDIVPSGAARRYWVNFLGLQRLTYAEQDSILLEKGGIAPVGNLRIKEALPPINPDSTLHLRYFSQNDVADRNVDFLEYAQQMGAISGGATGAGGEAPKLLIRATKDQNIWIDTYQQNFDQPDQHYLVKFPRNNRSEIDCNILRAEYYYYQELKELGFNTIETTEMKLIEGEKYPSLWLPRFDVEWRNQCWQRHGLESVYSVLNKASGSHLNHFEVIDNLCDLLTVIDSNFDATQFICEWLQRDLLNIIFGNSDNHGRNTSFLKKSGKISLAPIYDFAPMKADPEVVTRSTTWGSPYEEGGEYRWEQITQKLAHLCDPNLSMKTLKSLANNLVGLKQRLIDKGVPKQIMEMPALSFDYVEAKLERWELL